MKKERKKHSKVWIVLLCLLAVLIVAALVFMHFGGFGTGDSTDTEAFAAYAGTVDDISIPDNVKIIALGEATHGNSEFQQLKLDVFRHLVKNYGVRALALEGDFGGCEQVNRYIHGGEGTANDAAAAIGFAIYRTDEMAELISYMRQYNETAAEGDDLRFVGFDMQRCGYNLKFLSEACSELGVDDTELKKLGNGEEWSDGYDTAARVKIITEVKTALEAKDNSAKAVQFANILLQNCELQAGNGEVDSDLRDKFMAENTQWIVEQESMAGHGRIFVTAHNGHVGRFGYDNMGKLLADEMGDDYYVIGTDFYKTNCNLPRGTSKRRTNQVLYSHDTMAKTAKMAGFDICWLDFAKASESPELSKWISNYNYMGSLGEGYFIFMRILPPSYRIFQTPSELYDGMIFVADATPTEIIGEK